MYVCYAMRCLTLMNGTALPIEESLRSMKSSGKKVLVINLTFLTLVDINYALYNAQNSHSLQKMSLDSSKSKKSQPNLSANSMLIKSNPNLSLVLSTTKPLVGSNSTSNSNSNIRNVQNISQTSKNPNLSPTGSIGGPKHSESAGQKSNHSNRSSSVLGQGSTPINEGNLTSSVHSSVVGEKPLTQKSFLSAELDSTLPHIHPQMMTSSSSSSGSLTLAAPVAVTDGQQLSELVTGSVTGSVSGIPSSQSMEDAAIAPPEL